MLEEGAGCLWQCFAAEGISTLRRPAVVGTHDFFFAARIALLVDNHLNM